jgi:hypothetical protein
MSTYFKVVGIFVHLVLIFSAIWSGVDYLITNIEVGRHEYIMTSYNIGMPYCKSALEEAMADGRLTYREYWLIKDLYDKNRVRKAKIALGQLSKVEKN